ncbi:MAG: Na/Pi cotransporter family protein [Alphaproteobacteria bacterium]|nr:Na/Pi cotransporter family protein [Alphaproteobacteria bacterium]
MAGGVCLLLWGVSMVSGGLNRAFGASLRRVISNSTSNRFKAFGVGVFVATILQSSTATSLIVSSFAARNVVTIAGAIALMLGADVGTTLAAQFMSLDLHWLVPVLLVSGFLVNSTMEASQYKYLGRTLVGIALALIALSMIREAATPLKESPAMEVLVAPLRSQPILAISLSVLITWLVHSGLGMVLLYMSFVAAGTIPIELGLYLVLGANIGSALAPVIMTMRDIPAGRRVPLGNLLIRGLGVVIFLPFMESLVIPFIESLHADPARMVVNFHTAFNLIVAMMFLPFIHSMTRVSEVILPDRPREEDESLPRYLDPTAFDQPPAALASVARETLRISDIVEKMLDQTLECLRNNDAHMLQNIRNLEGTVDTLYEACKNYMARLSTQSFDSAESRRYMQIMTFSTNLEHIGDIIDKNLLEMAAKKIHNQDHFSRQGFAEISALHTSVMESLKLAQNVFMTGDVSMAKKLFKDKTAMRKQEILAAESHFKRLSEGVAETIATSSLHLDILRDLRRINSYLSLIAYPILEEADALHRTRLKDKSAKGKKPAKAKKNADKDLDGNL